MSGRNQFEEDGPEDAAPMWWGAEVSQKSVPWVPPPLDARLHLSQVTMGPGVKENARAYLRIKVQDSPPLVIAALKEGHCENVSLDLVFDEYCERVSALAALLFSVEGDATLHIAGYLMYMNDEEPEFGGRPMGVMGGEEEEESSDEEPYTPEEVAALKRMIRGEGPEDSDDEEESDEDDEMSGSDDDDLVPQLVDMEAEEGDTEDSDEDSDEDEYETGEDSEDEFPGATAHRKSTVVIEEILSEAPEPVEAASNKRKADAAAMEKPASSKKQRQQEQKAAAAAEAAAQSAAAAQAAAAKAEAAAAQKPAQTPSKAVKAAEKAAAKSARKAEKAVGATSSSSGAKGDGSGKGAATTPAAKADKAPPKTPATEKAAAKTPSGDKAAAKTPAADKSAAKQQRAASQQATPSTPADTLLNGASPNSGKKGVRKFPNGLEISDVAMGQPDGKVAKAGKRVKMRYIGRLASNGKIFDQTRGNKTFAFRLGVGEVISGWDKGIEGMRVGDKRKLTIPPSMGYGSSGAPPDIPGNATLVFDVELVNVM